MGETSNVILCRRDRPFVGWVAIDEFEDMFARFSGSEVWAPSSRRLRPGLVGRAQRRLLGDFKKLDPFPQKGDLLLVVARAPGDLTLINSIGNFRKNYRHVAAFIIDSYFTDALGPVAKKYDHIFSTTELGAETIQKRFGISSSVLRQGFDCLKWSCVDESRSIDLIGFGRQPASYHQAFQSRFHRQDSPLLYLHSPIGSMEGNSVWVERPMLLKLLQRSKISLAFHLGIEPSRNRPFHADFLTSRWYESLTCGCLVVGKRPPGVMATEMLAWENSTIELPDDPIGAIGVISVLAADRTFQKR
ncbi:glycosyltransferase family 1 protein [Tardiphaga robiniae]|uniref:Glycosyltransferase family 1 protein n=1 Tax=Tardiphaga robiniae TaxID=943830 RepID=A0A7G6TUK2_9BRAD|nr:glycosyltransferase family 1 protein [Tardiphaga robiniae]QND70434.1 glycosyltransferase family 1 protein [Tardiphaga robiniae]